MKVEIYSTPACIYCKHAKKLFEENDIPYTEYNVAQDVVKREEMVQMTQQRGVPVIVLDGRNYMVGFDKEALKKALKI